MRQDETEWVDFRDLFHAIDDYEGASLSRDVLTPWLA